MNPFFTGIFYKLTVFASGILIIVALVLLLTKKTRESAWAAIGVGLSFVAFLPTVYQQWNYLYGTTINYSLPSRISEVVASNGSKCFSGDGTLMIGNQVSSDVVQCYHTDKGRLLYFFSLPVDVGGALQIVGIKGTFGIDQQNVNLPNATVTWQILYNGDLICNVTAHWRQPGHCTNVPDTPVVQDKMLAIEQTANDGTGNTRQSLFAGIIDPVLVLRDYRS